LSQYPEASPENYPEYVAEALQDTWSVTPEALTIERITRS